MTDIEELKRLAEAATPGNWRIAQDDGGMVRIETDDPAYVSGYAAENKLVIGSSEWTYMKDDDAAFVSAANPQTVLALIDEIEDLRRQVKSMERY